MHAVTCITNFNPQCNDYMYLLSANFKYSYTYSYNYYLYSYDYRIAGNFDGGNIDGLASFRKLTWEILTDSLLDNLYLLYN